MRDRRRGLAADPLTLGDNMATRSKGAGSKASLSPRSTTPAEWVAAALGAAVVIAMVGCLTWYGFQGANGAPDVTIVRNGPAVATSGGYRVEFTARNAGGATAGQLRIEGELSIGGRVAERSVMTMDYLPSHSERRGGLFFRQDPGAGELSIYPTGYEKP